jgi:GrpB-like predicted nucleotidyltransferase (UPF0157 family)
VFYIYKYSSSFVSLFQKKRDELKKILENSCLIEHIGSTSITGMDGKGIIDIMLVFDDAKKIKTKIKILQKNGYFLIKDNIDRKERTFMTSSDKKESILGDIHLHLTIKNSDDYLNAILFRDYLKKHPKEKKEYIDLKYEIYKNVDGNRSKYTELKSDFIKKIINLAKNPISAYPCDIIL